MARVAVIGGTSESVFICKKLENNYDLLVFAATEDGKRITDGIRCSVHTGRLDYAGFHSALDGISCVVDASHPFAEEVSRNVKRACADVGLPYIRYLRKKGTYNYSNIVYVTDKTGAAEYLNRTDGRILFTTGSKTARFYERAVCGFNSRAVMRVMDSELARGECGALGGIVIYKRPPFTEADNIDLIQKYGIKIMVSKDSGQRGGVPQKVSACKAHGIPLVLIKSPEEDGVEDTDEVLRLVCQYCERR